MNHNQGIGATPELYLRVSVATLVRVVFKHPDNGKWMLALECKATVHENEVSVKSQPFGGAIRILDLEAIHDLIGEFHFDSERSRAEQDFRLLIRPSSWPVLRELCIQRLSRDHDLILETDPMRELVEEFADALKVNLLPEQTVSKPVAIVLENEATPTENIHTKGVQTVRVYRIFEATITHQPLVSTMLNNSARITHRRMCELALGDAREGGKGRANAVYALPLKAITDIYLALSPKERNSPIFIEEIRIDETVPAILEDIPVPKYQRL